MAEILFLVRVGFLVLLWLFVLVAVLAVRNDWYGVRPARAMIAPNRVPRTTRRAQRVGKGQPRLVVLEGPLAGTSVTLGIHEVTIGRADSSTLVLTDDYASNHHAKVAPDGGGGFTVADNGSTNGTWLDRARVQDPVPLPPGVPIRVGRTVLELRQ